MGEDNGLLKRISIDPKVCHGKACIRGTRIMVHVVLANLAEGMSIAELCDQYPPLTPEDVNAACAYAAEMVNESVIPVPVES